MSTTRLTPVSYVVLGLVEAFGTATPYDLKRAAAAGVGHFWSLPHTQLYSEPARLAVAGYLDEEREPKGRRRRLYTLTNLGSEALNAWRETPTTHLYEIRDAGLLQLFFGADPAKLAVTQLEAHRENLRLLEARQSDITPEVPEGIGLALEAGIGHAREYVRFWTGIASATPHARTREQQ